MVRLLAAAVLGALLASACDEGQPQKTPGHASIVKQCIKDGGDEKTCNCAADRTEDLLKTGVIDEDMFRVLVLEAEGKAEESEKLLDAMSIDKKFAQSTAVGEAKLSCGTVG